MYVLSHGCFLSSYKDFFNLHTWVFLSCVLTYNGCKCLFVVYAFFIWEASCYESYLVSYDVSIYCMLNLVDPYEIHYILSLDIILLELVLFDHSLLPFLLVYFFIARRLCINDVAHQYHITRVCLRPLEVSSYYSSFYILLNLFLLLWKLQVHLHVCLLELILNCHHLFFGTSLILLFL